LREIAVGVVGCGWNSDKHLRVYSNAEGVNVVAICDIDLAKAKEKARHYGVKQVFTEFDSMLNLDLDLVDIVTPTITHSELSVRALESGHNVLVEKPMATSSRECLRMIDAARKSGRTLCVVHNKRFFDSIIQTKATLERENLKVSRLRVTQFFHPPHKASWIMTEESGGILWDALVHHTYLTLFFFGKIESVYATANKIKQPVHDSINIIFNSGSKIGLGELMWDAKEPMTKFQLFTEQGDRFDGDLDHDFVLRRSRRYKNYRITAFRSLFDDLYIPFVKWTGHLQNLFEMRSFERALPFEKTFFVLIRQLLSFLAGRRTSPPVTAEEGLQAIRVLEAAKKSIETSKEQVLYSNTYVVKE